MLSCPGRRATAWMKWRSASGCSAWPNAGAAAGAEHCVSARCTPCRQRQARLCAKPPAQRQGRAPGGWLRACSGPVRGRASTRGARIVCASAVARLQLLAQEAEQHARRDARRVAILAHHPVDLTLLRSGTQTVLARLALSAGSAVQGRGSMACQGPLRCQQGADLHALEQVHRRIHAPCNRGRHGLAGREAGPAQRALQLSQGVHLACRGENPCAVCLCAAVLAQAWQRRTSTWRAPSTCARLCWCVSACV